jgi:hypothetical protein
MFTLWEVPYGEYFDFKFIRFRIYSGSIGTKVKFRPYCYDTRFSVSRCEFLDGVCGFSPVKVAARSRA